MKKIKCVRIKFANSIEFNEIPAFRAAIAKLHPQKSVLLHHHLNDEQLLYRYPVLQYKIYNEHPYIMALEEGTDLALKLAEHKEKTISIYKKQVDLEIESLNLFHHTVQVWDKTFSYKIYNWLALNGENYQKFQRTTALKDRVKMLEDILTAHILAFTEGIHYMPEKEIFATIHKIHAQRWIMYKKISRAAFDLTFETNISLPDYIGLGKSPSVGFGMIKKTKKIENIFANPDTLESQKIPVFN